MDEKLVVDFGTPVTAGSALVVHTNVRSAVARVSVSDDGVAFRPAAQLDPEAVNDGRPCIQQIPFASPDTFRFLRIDMNAYVVDDYDDIDAIGVAP
jgi:hypothetical protein